MSSGRGNLNTVGKQGPIEGAEQSRLANSQEPSGGPFKTPTDLYAFGGKDAPRPPRSGTDLSPDDFGMIGPEELPFPKGASTFANPNEAPLSGHYHKLPAGTELPKGFGVIADGSDIMPLSPHQPTHHTLYPTTKITATEFSDAFTKLPWEYGGKKKK